MPKEITIDTLKCADCGEILTWWTTDSPVVEVKPCPNCMAGMVCKMFPVPNVED